jgi:hypothetical protein
VPPMEIHHDPELPDDDPGQASPAADVDAENNEESAAVDTTATKVFGTLNEASVHGIRPRKKRVSRFPMKMMPMHLICFTG